MLHLIIRETHVSSFYRDKFVMVEHPFLSSDFLHGIQICNGAASTRFETMGGFGLIILMNRIQFSRIRFLWSSQVSSKYNPPPLLDNIISRLRFEELRNNVTFSFPAASSDR